MSGNDEYFIDAFSDYIQKELTRLVAEQPWWCPICGEGGNYDTPEPPANWWYPPLDHICAEDARNTHIKVWNREPIMKLEDIFSDIGKEVFSVVRERTGYIEASSERGPVPS